MSAMIRNATAADADAIATLAREFQAYLRALGDRTYFEFTAETYRRDGFGPNPAFSSLVAERDSQVIGYLLYHFGYDTDRAMRLMHVIDLSVQASQRRRGVGQALMRRAAEMCREAGGRELIWSFFSPNTPAFQFYEYLGAKQIKELEFMSWPVPVREDPCASGISPPRSRPAILCASIRSFLALPPWMAFIYKSWPRTKGRPFQVQRSASQDQVKIHSTQTTRSSR
jgi:GNAT superfamily N-acetyltransferase